MSFKCPVCNGQASLAIRSRLELPPDADWDEIALQEIRCGICAFSGLAVYTESRRGALDRELVHHTGYHLPPEYVARIVRQIGSCPSPSDRSCGCRAHLLLAVQDEAGRWADPGSQSQAASFPMQLRR